MSRFFYAETESRAYANYSPNPSPKLQVGYDYGVFLATSKSKAGPTLEPVYWEPDKLTNHHIGILGNSGSGKTHFIRQFMSAMPEDVTLEILDYHGDINTNMSGTKTLMFSQNTRYGYNPLVVNTNVHYGGVRRACNDVIDAINATSHKLGGRQVNVLRNLMLDAYVSRGIYEDRPETWHKKIGTTEELDLLRANNDEEALFDYYPTLRDVLEIARRRLRALYLSIDDREEGMATLDYYDEFTKAQASFGRLKKEISRVERLEQAADETLNRLAEKRDELMDKCVTKFRDFLSSMESGKDLDDAINYSNKDILQSVCSRLEELINIGLFEPNPPPWGDARVRRYYLKPLAQSSSELIMFVRFRLQAIIREMMQEGESNGKLRRLIVLDESKVFNNNEMDNPINIIATQMRKFGLGLMMASQSPVHLSDDFVKNAGTLILLNLSTTDWDDTARSLKIPRDVLQHLVPQQIAAIRMIEAGGQQRFKGIYMKGGRRRSA